MEATTILLSTGGGMYHVSMWKGCWLPRSKLSELQMSGSPATRCPHASRRRGSEAPAATPGAAQGAPGIGTAPDIDLVVVALRLGPFAVHGIAQRADRGARHEVPQDQV